MWLVQLTVICVYRGGQKDCCMPNCLLAARHIIWSGSETSTRMTYCCLTGYSSWHQAHSNFPVSFPAVFNCRSLTCYQILLLDLSWFHAPALFSIDNFPQTGFSTFFTHAIWWLACLFCKHLCGIRIFLQALPGLYYSFTKIASHWQIHQVRSLFPKYQSHIQRITELEGTSERPAPELLLMRIYKTFC